MVTVRLPWALLSIARILRTKMYYFFESDEVEVLKKSKEWLFIQAKFEEHYGDLDDCDDEYIRKVLFYGCFDSGLDFAKDYLDTHLAVWAYEGNEDCYGCHAARYVCDSVDLNKLLKKLTEFDDEGFYLLLETIDKIYVYWCGVPHPHKDRYDF